MLEIATVIDAFAEVLAQKRETCIPIRPDTKLGELGFDSLDLAEVLIVIEERICSEVTVGRSVAGSTIRDFHDMLAIHSDGNA